MSFNFIQQPALFDAFKFVCDFKLTAFELHVSRTFTGVRVLSSVLQGQAW